MKSLNYAVTLSAHLLRAAATIAPKGDKRYYLNGVYVHFDGQSTLTYVATNGHVLVALRETVTTDDGTVNPENGPWEMIIPREVATKSTPIGKHTKRLTLTPNGTGFVLGLVKGVDLMFQAIDGRFPDWRRVISLDAPSGELAQFNPQLVADACHALGIANELSRADPMTRWPLEHNGNGPGRIVTEAGVAVIMPYRSGEPMEVDADMRDWVRGYRLETAPQDEAMAA